MEKDPPYRLQQSVAYHLSLAARVHERHLDEQLKTLGLTRTTWCILLAVGNEGHSQPSDIADFVGIDRTATSRALRHMEDQGLLARSSGTQDRRTRRVELTERGCRAITLATPFARENAHNLAQLLDPAEIDELKRLLSKLRQTEGVQIKTL